MTLKKSTFGGFKFVSLQIITGVVAMYILACSQDDKLISLQGVILALITLYGGIMAIRENTKKKGIEIKGKVNADDVNS